MLHMVELLLHSDEVPLAARVALSSALASPPDQRYTGLVEAARILHHDAGLDCEDARELVGLGGCGCDDATS